MKIKNYFYQIARICFLLTFCLFFMGCRAFVPFVDARREAGQIAPIGSSTDDKPVICYSFQNRDEVERLAQNECAKTGRTAVFEQTENFSCALFAPRKAIYRCEKTDKPVPEYQPSCPVPSEI